MRGRSKGRALPRAIAALAASATMGAALLPLVAMAQEAAPRPDATRGAHVFQRCALCHVIDPAAKDLLAPPLHNIIGRRAAQIPGFQYSEIMRFAGEQGLVWTEQALYHFLADPEGFMPGTYMAFSGLEDSELRDVLAYLIKLSEDTKRAQEQAARRATAPPITAPAWRTLPPVPAPAPGPPPRIIAPPEALPQRPAAQPAGQPVSPPPAARQLPAPAR